MMCEFVNYHVIDKVQLNDNTCTCKGTIIIVFINLYIIHFLWFMSSSRFIFNSAYSPMSLSSETLPASRLLVLDYN